MFKYFKPREYSRPLPELLDGDDWEVRNSDDLKIAYVDFKKREFVVPFKPGAAGELVRAHEAMHVKITPEKCKYTEGDFVTYQAVEDARVNQALRNISIPTDHGEVYSEKELTDLLSMPDVTPLRMAECYFATKGLYEEKHVTDLIKVIHPKVLPIAEEVYEKYFGSYEAKKEFTPFEEVDKAIKELKEKIPKIETSAQASCNAANQNKTGKTGRSLTEAYIPGSNDRHTYRQELPILTEVEIEEIKDAIPYYNNSYDEKAIPGKMSIERVRLDNVIKFKKVKSIKTSPSDEGVIPANMHRFTTDQKVFTRKGRRRQNAAVLIDVSSSMGLSQEEVEKIVRQSPAAIIAIYSGYGKSGVLRIIAEKGRVSSRLNANMGGSNVVDLPALEWLGKQKEKKKLWVSDGYVTGEGDRLLDPLYIRKIYYLITQKKIERVGNVRELIKNGALIDAAFEDGHKIGSSIKSYESEDDYEDEDYYEDIPF